MPLNISPPESPSPLAQQTISAHQLSMLTHDLRNPLHALDQLALLVQGEMRHTQVDASVFTYLGLMRQSIGSMLDMVNLWLLHYQHPAIEPLPHESVILATLAHEAVLLYQAVAELKHIEVTINIPLTLEVPLNTLLLRTILHNLLSNALQHSPTGGEVTLRATQEREGLTLWVGDNGPGLPQQPAYVSGADLLQYGSERQPTHGLGLTLCYACIVQQGGTLDAFYHPGQGSIFRVFLPFAQGALS
jgi:signal transduction histidine kinase